LNFKDMITMATQPLTYNTVNTTSASTITLTGPPINSTIYSTPTGTAGSIATSTITSGTPYTITGAGANSIWLDEGMETCITIGKHEINEGNLGDLLVLLQVVKELDDDNPIKDMFNTIKMLNKIKGKK
tara:strand:- start:237 stop:623 length:387 start_codon:yes stop_codon:yes gene_type:complete